MPKEVVNDKNWVYAADIEPMTKVRKEHKNITTLLLFQYNKYALVFPM